MPLRPINNGGTVSITSETIPPARITTRRNAIDRDEEVEVNNENLQENKENIPEILGNILGEQISN